MKQTNCGHYLQQSHATYNPVRLKNYIIDPRLFDIQYNEASATTTDDYYAAWWQLFVFYHILCVVHSIILV